MIEVKIKAGIITEEPRKLPEQKLLAALLGRAICDILAPRAVLDTRSTTTREAETWMFYDTSTHPFSFSWVTSHLKIPSDDVREVVNKAMKNPTIARRIVSCFSRSVTRYGVRGEEGNFKKPKGASVPPGLHLVGSASCATSDNLQAD